jgi:hypothetical protein
MPTPGGTRIENPSLESVNNTRHLCQRLSQHSSLMAKSVTTRVTSGEARDYAWSANFKMVWYVLLRPRRPELDDQLDE